MGALTRSSAIALLVLVLGGCGPTVGDPCTTHSDCSGQLCITQPSHTPGGYCSRPCTPGVAGSCPGGSICVVNGGEGVDACLRTCKQDTDCRNGYLCRERFRESAEPVCVGAAALP